MKNMKLPDSDKWKKIVDDAFSSDEFHTFSENYNMKKHSMQSVRKGITMKKNNLIMNLTVAAAALTVIAVPTVIYLGSNTTQQYTQVSDEESPSDEVTVAESTQAAAIVNDNETEVTITDCENDGQVNEEIHQFTEEEIDFDTIYDIEYGWLPEGLEYNEDDPYAYKFKNVNNDRSGMTLSFTKFSDGVKITDIVNRCKDNEEYTIDGKTVTISYRDDYEENTDNYNFGRIAYISFDNTPYSLSLWVTDDITKADLRKIIDNVKLVPSEEETAEIYTPPQNKQENTEFTIGSYENSGIKAEDSVIAQVGEPVQEMYPDVWGEVSATVTDVHFSKNLDGIITDGRGWEADYSEYLNENGTLVENVRKWIKFDNGTETEFKTETVPVSVMTVNITYTNNGTEPLVNDYCVCPTLQTEYDGYFFKQSTFDVIEMQTAEMTNSSIDYIDTFWPLTADDMHFSFSCPNQSSTNNIHLEAGESTEVTLAFIVEDNLRDNLYLSMNNNGFVDLSDIE